MKKLIFLLLILPMFAHAAGISSTNNPFLTNTTTAPTTANIPDSINKRYVTDAQLVVIGNTSGTNTGDQTTITGNAGTASALQTGRTIGMTGPITWTSPSFNGSANITAAATVTSQTGTGSKFVMDTSPALITPNIGVAAGTSLATTGAISSSTNITGSNLIATNTILMLEAGAPGTSAPYGRIYIDSADGDLKIVFQNGVIKTLATN
jgi:hypothetical protein